MRLNLPACRSAMSRAMKIGAVLSALVPVAIPAFSRAQTASSSLSLEQALIEAKEHSPRIDRAEAAAREAEWAKTEAFSGFLPTVSLLGTHYFEKKYQFTDVPLNGIQVSIPGIYPTTSASFTASLPIFDGLANVNRYSAGRLRASAAKGEAGWTVFQVEQDIRLKFYQALASQRLLEVARQNVATIEDHLKQTQTMRRGGVATNYDVLRIEVQLSEALSDRLQAEDNVQLARQRLAVAMGLESDPRPLEGDLPDPQEKLTSVRPMTFVPVGARADLQAQAQRVEAAEKNRKALGAYWIPKISLAAQYIYYNNLTDSPAEFDKFRTAYNLGVTLNWNLFDGLVGLSREREAAEQGIQAERAYRQTVLQAPLDFDFWKRRLFSSAAVYNARRTDIDKATESVRLARAGFKAGTRTSTEVLDAELELFRARAGVVNAMMSCAESTLNLELALGRRL